MLIMRRHRQWRCARQFPCIYGGTEASTLPFFFCPSIPLPIARVSANLKYDLVTDSTICCCSLHCILYLKLHRYIHALRLLCIHTSRAINNIFESLKLLGNSLCVTKLRIIINQTYTYSKRKI